MVNTMLKKEFIILRMVSPRYYFASDNLQSEHYTGLTPHDLIDIAMIP
jgi:hypothetical protein